MPDAEALSASRPFPGLRPFESQDRDYFCGREDQCFALFDLLEMSQFVAVVGSSGSGKSSLVRAGLLPLLEQETEESEAREREDAASGHRKWRWIEFRPGDSPLSRLAEQLAALGGTGTEDIVGQAARRETLDATLRRSSYGLSEALSAIDDMADHSLLIVVDQFEELFRYGVVGAARARLQEERDQFVQLLLTATSGRDLDVRVMITMRSDFIGDCSQFYGLPEVVSQGQFLVPALTRLQCEEVICHPLEPDLADAYIEPALVEQLLNDIGGEYDQLPVLQHCLSRLWEVAGPSSPTPPHRRLLREHYRRVGGIAGALSRHADEILADLAGDEIAVEQVFRALSEEDSEGRATRRALNYGRLRDETGIADDVLRRVVDRFRADDCSFLVPSISARPRLNDDMTVDIGHEALLRRWRKVSGEELEALGEDSGTGWLEAEANDAHDYQMLLRLAGDDPTATLPLNRVDPLLKRWKGRPRTAAWAERYGGRIGRVEQLFANTIMAKRQRRWSRAAVVSIIVLLVIGASLSLYQSFELQRELADNARQERAVVLSVMTEITQSVATDLRYIPGTSNAILKMLGDVQAFSKRFSALLQEHYPEGLNASDKIVEEVLTNRVALLQANYSINFGDLSEAIDLLTETEKKIAQMPRMDGVDPPVVKLLRGDLLSYRAAGEMTYGRYDDASADYAKAEEIYRDIFENDDESARAKSASAMKMLTGGDKAMADLDYPQKAKQGLARLYQRRFFFHLRYDEDVKAATTDLTDYREFVDRVIASLSPETDDETSEFWKRRARAINRSEADLLVAQGEFDSAIKVYSKQLEEGPTSSRISAERFRAFLGFRLASALLGRAKGDDITEAIRHLERSKDTFSHQARIDPENMWWRLVWSWVEYELGRAYHAESDLTNALEAFEAAKEINVAFLDADPENLRARKDLERIEAALTALADLGWSD